MLVNNVDIKNYKAELLSKDIQTADVITYDDWLKKASNPLYVGTEERYKAIKLSFSIGGSTEEDKLNNISNLVKALERCTLKFDDLSFYYDATIANKSHTKHTKNLWSLDVELKSPYAYKSEVVETANRVLSKTINVPGNLMTPAIIEITPSIDIIDITVSGFSENFTMKNLKQGQKVIVNGNDCTVLQNGANKFGDFDGWEFPLLSPGVNSIGFSRSNCDVSIRYKPKYI